MRIHHVIADIRKIVQENLWKSNPGKEPKWDLNLRPSTILYQQSNPLPLSFNLI